MKGNSVSTAYTAIKKKILHMDLKAGQHLDEKALIQELNIGRTPLRQAFVLLKNENLIAGEPNRTPFVTEFSIAETKEIFEALIIVEKNVTCLASQRATNNDLKKLSEINEQINTASDKHLFWELPELNSKFHNAIAQMAHNRYLLKSHTNIRTQTDRLSYLSVSFEKEESEARDIHNLKIREEHKKIIECLQNRDFKGAEKIAIKHVKNFHQRIADFLLNIDYV